MILNAKEPELGQWLVDVPRLSSMGTENWEFTGTGKSKVRPETERETEVIHSMSKARYHTPGFSFLTANTDSDSAVTTGIDCKCQKFSLIFIRFL